MFDSSNLILNLRESAYRICCGSQILTMVLADRVNEEMARPV